jgi:hypothetical protein
MLINMDLSTVVSGQDTRHRATGRIFLMGVLGFFLSMNDPLGVRYQAYPAKTLEQGPNRRYQLR